MLLEPNVPMDKLVEATLAQGLLPKVVMEVSEYVQIACEIITNLVLTVSQLPNITVGGG